MTAAAPTFTDLRVLKRRMLAAHHGPGRGLPRRPDGRWTLWAHPSALAAVLDSPWCPGGTTVRAAIRFGPAPHDGAVVLPFGLVLRASRLVPRAFGAVALTRWRVWRSG